MNSLIKRLRALSKEVLDIADALEDDVAMDKKNVGALYHCKGCDNTYKARTTRHVWCDSCREKRVIAAKIAKAKLKGGLNRIISLIQD